MTCCAGAGCRDRRPLPGGGWVCGGALALGLLDDDVASGQRPPRGPGWSRGVVLACPRCGGRSYSPGPRGLPQRRCHDRRCGHIWDPEQPPNGGPERTATMGGHVAVTTTRR